MKSKQIQSNRTGIYLRLSKDDERAGESISIENQRLMLTKYVEEKGWKIAGEYVDDGYTGTNFDRPEVQRMIDDVHMGRLDIVIVKDLSRFGRNYIEVGRYIDYEFPLYNIRFIALSDNIDTADKNSTAMDMMPIMNVFNTLMKAALMAPTSKRSNAWQFIVVDEKDKLKELSYCKEQASQFIADAALAVVVVADPLASDVWIEDASIASIYLQLQAEDMGLGSCWVQVRERFTASGMPSGEYVHEVLDIPLQLQVLSVIAIGHKGMERKPFNEDNLQWEKIHINKYGGK